MLDKVRQEIFNELAKIQESIDEKNSRDDGIDNFYIGYLTGKINALEALLVRIDKLELEKEA